MHSFIAAGVVLALSTSAYGASCSSFKTTTVNGLTLTGPFALTAGGGGDGASWVGKYARSGPPDGSCCNNFFVFGIPASKEDENATNFYLSKDGSLISVQNNVVYTAFENNPDDPLNAHVLLGTESDIGGNPLITCALDGDTCALDCSVSGYSFNCLGSPGYQPDWRIAEAQAGAGPGCAEFTPMAVPPSSANDAPLPSNLAAPSNSSSSSVAPSSSSSSAAATTKKKTTSKATTSTKIVQTTDGSGGFAQASPASSSSAIESGNLAIRTAAPVIVANAAIALGIFAAL